MCVCVCVCDCVCACVRVCVCVHNAMTIMILFIDKIHSYQNVKYSNKYLSIHQYTNCINQTF